MTADRGVMAFDILHGNDTPGSYPDTWYHATVPTGDALAPLEGRSATQICVIGAGYSGLSAALHLAQSGHRVTVLDAHRIGWGASGRNGGQVSSGQRVDQAHLERMVGSDGARWLWRMAGTAKGLVRDLVGKFGIDCELVPGIIHADHRRRFVAASRAHVRLMHEEYGYGDIRFLCRDEMRAQVASPGYYGGTHDGGAFHLHPLKYVLGLARAALDAGVTIHENSQVRGWRDGATPAIDTDRATLSADHVIFACNGYLGDLEGRIAASVMPINNFLVATQPLGNDRAAALIPDNSAVADSRFVINYFRRTADHRLLFGGGEAYGYRFPADIASFVGRRMRAVFPQLKDVSIDFEWGGTLAITRNRLPHFGRIGENCWSVSGYSGHGVSIATLAGKLVAEAVSGRTADFERMKRFSAGRFPGGVLLRVPLLVLAMHWYALRDRF